MAEEEPLLVNPPTHDAAVHVRDYLRFTTLLKWSSLTVLVITFILITMVL